MPLWLAVLTSAGLLLLVSYFGFNAWYTWDWVREEQKRGNAVDRSHVLLSLVAAAPIVLAIIVFAATIESLDSGLDVDLDS